MKAGAMIHRSIEMDSDKCARVARLLGTESDSDTVDKAFDLLLGLPQPGQINERFVASVRSGHYADMFDEQVTTRTWW